MAGPSFSGRTYLRIKKLRLVFTRDLFNIIRTPEQYNDESKTEREVRKINEYKAKIVVFDDAFDINQKQLDAFPMIGRHKKLVVRCFSESYLDSRKKVLRNKNNARFYVIANLKRCRKNLERESAGFDMSYHEFEGFCGET